MNIPLRIALAACLIVAVLSAVLTRHYFPQIQTKTVTVDKEVIRNDIQTVVHSIKEPNGDVDTTTTTTDHSIKIDVDKSTAETLQKPTMNISAIMANDVSHSLLVPTYGISISKQVLGPFTIGLFGLTNGTGGVSLGINF